MIDGEPISNAAFVSNWNDIRPFLDITDAELNFADEQPLSFFEALTLLAFAAFADAPVDVVVLEVGMGGEWDSTNVADGQVAVFTPIALDHMARLGNTVAEIARTKSGIIKPAAAVGFRRAGPRGARRTRTGGRADRVDARGRGKPPSSWCPTRSPWAAR